MSAKAIPGYPGYYADEQGNIWSERKGSLTLKSSTENHKGYLRVGIMDRGRQRCLSVHSLVALAFLGERPDGYDICHNDGNPRNNTPKNLRYDTRSNNAKDRFLHGRNKLNERDYQDIRWLRGMNVSQVEVAQMYGVSKRNVTLITRGR
jgi:hypothetical protein